jgi:beta-fructofuranosidase
MASPGEHLTGPPRHHIRPTSGWLNDPNGLLRWNGRYHVFFQHNPAAATHGNIHWGHASSADLLAWRSEPIALAPTPGGADELGCWSGCVVDDDGVPTAVYTGVRAGQLDLGAICLARAEPGSGELRHFIANGIPVVDGPPPEFDATVFRDPFVFSFRGHRYAAVGAGSQDGPALLLYACDDLTRWAYVGVLLDHADELAQRVAPGAAWECPQLVSIAGRWVLLLSLWSDGRPDRAVALVGDLITQPPSAAGIPGLRFRPTGGGPVDLGTDFYAPAVLVEAGRVLMWGWAWEAGPPDVILGSGWSGVLTLPREIDLDPAGRLAVRPARELAGLRGRHLVSGQLVLATQPVRVSELPSAVWVTVRWAGLAGSARIVLAVAKDAQLAVEIDTVAGTVVLDRSAWGTMPPRVGRIVAPVRPDAQPRLDIVIDGSILEMFVQKRVSMTERIYPRPGERRLLSVSGTDGAAIGVDAWRLA